MYPVSPITKSNNVKFIRPIKTNRIVKLYKQLGINVERFFNELSTIAIYECNDSKLKFYYPNTIAGDDTFYEDLDKILQKYYSDWKWEHMQAIKYITEKTNLLEIGCAYGSFLKRSIDVGAKNVCGLELNKIAVEDAQKNGLNVRLESVETHALSNPNFYDVVCSFQVAEHISNLDAFIRSSLDCLKREGTLIISVPNYNCYLYKNDIYNILNLPPHHMTLWTEDFMMNLATVYNLDVIEIIKQPSTKNNYGMYYEVFLRNTLKLNGLLKSIILISTRPIVKLIMILFPPKIGVCITFMYKKK